MTVTVRVVLGLGRGPWGGLSYVTFTLRVVLGLGRAHRDRNKVMDRDRDRG